MQQFTVHRFRRLYTAVRKEVTKLQGTALTLQAGKLKLQQLLLHKGDMYVLTSAANVSK